jgi:UDP-N-acetylmuramoylalanine--D-glutamate ligase
MGLGHFGGGIAVTRWLIEQGAHVTVTDLSPPEKLSDALQELAGLPIDFRLGGHDSVDLDGCQLLVISPAVPKDRSPFVADALARGIPISSEMNLFVERCRAQHVVGITGSAGKSTTTALLGSIVDIAFPGGSTGRSWVGGNIGRSLLTIAFPGGSTGRSWVGGNIGRSLLTHLDDIAPNDVVVLELSSFQLEDLGRLRWSPHLALITNIQPNHLDRHGTLDAYADAKMNILRFQKPSDTVFVHAGDSALADRVRGVGASGAIERFGWDSSFENSLRLPGPHNQFNASAAIALARALDVADNVIHEGIGRFRGLPHRLELVAEVDGVRYYNDSKSTTAESTRIAIDAFEQPVVVLVGGRGKGAPFDDLSRHLAKRAKAIVPYGETRHLFEEQIVRYSCEIAREVPIRSVGRLEEAVCAAREFAAPGDVVVLSPACTSYDLFSNYEERGETFRRAVQQMCSAGANAA